MMNDSTIGKSSGVSVNSDSVVQIEIRKSQIIANQWFGFLKKSAGEGNRPYEVPECVTAKEKKHKEYIRYNSSSIEAKLSDISRSRVFDYLNKIGSKLAEDEGTKDFVV